MSTVELESEEVVEVKQLKRKKKNKEKEVTAWSPLMQSID